MTEFSSGSLVKARGREWIVQPESDAELLVLKPLGGTDDEITGICRSLEPVESASFLPPSATHLGDDDSCRLLRDAVRLSFRSGAGPFRSFGRQSFEPRPYQLVPLLLALKLDPVRLLIADDVGVGKTVEAGLIARELLDRGEIERIAVLCPPHLAEQWQQELRSKFHLDAELVLASTASRLERDLGPGESLFHRYPFVVVSLDFIKSDRRRDEFLRHAEGIVIVDEAHTCAFGSERGGRHQRHQVVQGLSKKPELHLVLVTATPHSGKVEQFRSLLTFLDPDFEYLPDDLSGPANEGHRRRLARHFVQRRRADLRAFLAEETPFPERLSKEETYRLSPPSRHLLDQALQWARETVMVRDADPRGGRRRWWWVLLCLRSLAPSPPAAAATLRTRASTQEAENAAEVDLLGRITVLDLDVEDSAETQDLPPGADVSDDESAASPARRRLLELARLADAITADDDAKLMKALQIVKAMLKAGQRPIVFCRFIPTAEAVAELFRRKLGKGVQVEAVTGKLAPTDREARVAALGEHAERVLVATDCLSEGINLQDKFDAVLHYDLAWNPTRHEQREGRVDRYGQPKKEVHVVTLHGEDNLIDALVLEVLLRKHVEIRLQTGVSVPVPGDFRLLEEAIFKRVLNRDSRNQVLELDLFGDDAPTKTEALHDAWNKASDREKRSRTLYAQESIKVDEVAAELREARAAIGSGVDLRAFVSRALRGHGAAELPGHCPTYDLREVPTSLSELLLQAAGDTVDRRHSKVTLSFAPPHPEGALSLDRTHPFVESLASHILSTALDPTLPALARRAGAMTTRAVSTRTTLLLLRFRLHPSPRTAPGPPETRAGETPILSFSGPPSTPEWLPLAETESLLEATPARSTAPELARSRLEQVMAAIPSFGPRLAQEAEGRADQLLRAHRRVRSASDHRGVRYSVTPELPVDILGTFVLLPLPATA